MPREYEEDRRYQAWKDTPCDETLEKLYYAIERRARWHIGRRLSRSDSVLAADLASRAVLKKDQYKETGWKFSTWLNKFLRTELEYLIRDDPGRDEVSLEEAAGRSMVDSYDDEEALAAREKVCTLLRKLKGLNRRILVGKLRGLSDADIGKLCGLTPNAVECRWRKTIKNIVENDGF